MLQMNHSYSLSSGDVSCRHSHENNVCKHNRYSYICVMRVSTATVKCLNMLRMRSVFYNVLNIRGSVNNNRELVNIFGLGLHF